MTNPFRVLQVARAVGDEIAELLDDPKCSMVCRAQLRDSAPSIAANIREGMGRALGADRRQFYRYARGSAEETDEHMRVNFVRKRVPAATCWRIHNRLKLAVTMLDVLIAK